MYLRTRGRQVAYAAYKMRLHRIMGIYIVGVLSFLVIMFAAERAGLPRYWLGGIFLAATIGLYACIGIYSRTAEPSEYYVAGRRIPSMYNGMATAADWMSAASFHQLSGGLVFARLFWHTFATRRFGVFAGLDGWLLFDWFAGCPPFATR